jgi:hypothetical protein
MSTRCFPVKSIHYNQSKVVASTLPLSNYMLLNLTSAKLIRLNVVTAEGRCLSNSSAHSIMHFIQPIDLFARS